MLGACWLRLLWLWGEVRCVVEWLVWRMAFGLLISAFRISLSMLLYTSSVRTAGAHTSFAQIVPGRVLGASLEMQQANKAHASEARKPSA